MKKTPRKLSLSITTVRPLSEREASSIVGGIVINRSMADGWTCLSCPSTRPTADCTV
jgi:hypothetical protein